MAHVRERPTHSHRNETFERFHMLTVFSCTRFLVILITRHIELSDYDMFELNVYSLFPCFVKCTEWAAAKWMNLTRETISMSKWASGESFYLAENMPFIYIYIRSTIQFTFSLSFAVRHPLSFAPLFWHMIQYTLREPYKSIHILCW